MTFVNHTIGGIAIGLFLAAILGWNPLFCAIFFGFAAFWPDGGSWILWKLSQTKFWEKKGWKKWERWEMYGMCHLPYDPETKHGILDHYFKWIPSWGFHTWVVDTIVHPRAPKFLFPKFPDKWMDEIWIDQIKLWIGPSSKPWITLINIQAISKWMVMYVLLEVVLYTFYAFLIWIS